MAAKVLYIIDEFEWGGATYERCILDRPRGAQLVRLKKQSELDSNASSTFRFVTLCGDQPLSMWPRQTRPLPCGHFVRHILTI